MFPVIGVTLFVHDGDQEHNVRLMAIDQRMGEAWDVVTSKLPPDEVGMRWLCADSNKRRMIGIGKASGLPERSLREMTNCIIKFLVGLRVRSEIKHCISL